MMSAFTNRHKFLPGVADRERIELKRRLEEAIAWGIPDNETTGAAPGTTVGLMREALSEIEALELQLSIYHIQKK